MEQIDNTIENKSLESKPLGVFANWQINTCRKLMFNQLNKVTQVAIEIHEQGQVTVLGNKNADMVGQVKVLDPQTYRHFVKGGSIGAAEAYIEGLWQSPDLTKLIQAFAKCQSELDQLEKSGSFLTKLKNTWFHARNKNSESGSKGNILAHYDLGNELYTRFLDPEMMYSSAIYNENANDLDSAQLNKLETICQRLELSADDHLLEIGTGWGGLAIYAAKNYGCKVTTTTISDAQYQYAKDRIEALGLGDKITLLNRDYRKLNGQFDKLVSIEMIEAVGHQYFSTFFQQCNQRLKKGGKMLLQAITIADQRYQHYINNVDFIQRYIFPGGCLPSVSVMSQHIAKDTNMVIEQLDDIGLDYARTLADWRERFHASWHELIDHGFDERFKRLWDYYLCYCEGAFLERATSTVHLVARKH